MRKIKSTAAMLLLVSNSTFAGGFLTNTNQNVAFLRNPCRDAVIAIDGVYSNPAGVTFMNKGWHLSLNVQSAYQTRTATSSMNNGAFAMGIGNPVDGTKEFKGKAQAPVIPSMQLAYVIDRWAFSAGMAITGGGGKCVFDNGLGSFESQVAMVPQLLNILHPGTVNGYTSDSYLRGRQYYYGLQLGAGYQITKNLSAFVGGRLVYADCNYYGYVKDIQVKTPQGLVPAGQLFTGMGFPHFAALVADRRLDCDQTGWGFTPILGLDYKIGKWNFAAKYEFKTRVRLKNQSNNTSGVAEYDDGKILPADIPAILTLGAQYSILPTLRASVGYHYFFDKQATQYENREKHLSGGGQEFLAGLEYDINKRITASAGFQSTNYGLGDNSKYITDISFVTNSCSIGLGVGIKLTDKMNLNLAYFKTFYQTYDKHMNDYNGLKSNLTMQMTQLVGSGLLNDQEKAAVQAISTQMSHLDTSGTDRFKRTNDVFGIGLDISF